MLNIQEFNNEGERMFDFENGDINIMLSMINMKLRDEFSSLEPLPPAKIIAKISITLPPSYSLHYSIPYFFKKKRFFKIFFIFLFLSFYLCMKFFINFRAILSLLNVF